MIGSILGSIWLIFTMVFSFKPLADVPVVNVANKGIFASLLNASLFFLWVTYFIVSFVELIAWFVAFGGFPDFLTKYAEIGKFSSFGTMVPVIMLAINLFANNWNYKEDDGFLLFIISSLMCPFIIGEHYLRSYYLEPAKGKQKERDVGVQKS